jgi:hypothetical protein
VANHADADLLVLARSVLPAAIRVVLAVLDTLDRWEHANYGPPDYQPCPASRDCDRAEVRRIGSYEPVRVLSDAWPCMCGLDERRLETAQHLALIFGVAP